MTQAAASTATPAAPGPVIAYYDGQCPICVAEMKRYSRYGDHLVRLEDCTRPDLPADVDSKAALDALHVRLPSGEIVTGWAAFIAIWERLPGWRLLAALTRPAPVRIPLDFIYRKLAPYRPRRRCEDGVCAR